MTDFDLVDEIMNRIEQRKLSGIFRAVAVYCEQTRGAIVEEPELDDYLGSGQVTLELSAEILERVEKQFSLTI